MTNLLLSQPPKPTVLAVGWLVVWAWTLGFGCGRSSLTDLADEDLGRTDPGGASDSLGGSAGSVASGGSSGAGLASAPGGAAGGPASSQPIGGTIAGSSRGSGGQPTTPTTSTSTQASAKLSLFAGGIGGKGNLDGIGSAARFYGPAGMMADGKGNLFVADMANHSIRKIDLATGAVSTVLASSGKAGVFATSEDQLDGPVAVAVDRAGNLYVADNFSNVIRTGNLATGRVTTLAGGSAQSGHSEDTMAGVGAAVRFYSLADLVYDGAGHLFVADKSINAIGRIVLDTATVTTIAGRPWYPGNDDGIGGSARFQQPTGLALDESGNLYVADSGNDSIRKINLATHSVTTFVDFQRPVKIAYDGHGNLFVVDVNRTISKIVIATKTVARLSIPWSGEVSAGEISGLAADGAGHLYLADTTQEVIYDISIAQEVVVARFGSGRTQGNSDGIQIGARFSQPAGLAFDRKGNLFVADSGNCSVRRVATGSRYVLTQAGMNECGGDDGVDLAASFGGLSHLAIDGSGTLFIADFSKYVIRQMNTSSLAVTTLAGSAGEVGSLDGIGRSARLNFPSGVAVDGAGTLFVANAGDHTVRRIKVSTGAVTTLAGQAGQRGSSDGGATTLARFNAPSALALDDAGHLFVADTGNNSIRVVALATSQVTTLAGSMNAGSVDGSGRSALFDAPGGLFWDGAGNLLVADTGNSTVRKIDVKSGAVTTVVGRAGRAGVVPGPLPAGLNRPRALAFGPNGDLFITDEDAILVAHF